MSENAGGTGHRDNGNGRWRVSYRKDGGGKIDLKVGSPTTTERGAPRRGTSRIGLPTDAALLRLDERRNKAKGEGARRVDRAWKMHRFLRVLSATGMKRLALRAAGVNPMTVRTWQKFNIDGFAERFRDAEVVASWWEEDALLIAGLRGDTFALTVRLNGIRSERYKYARAIDGDGEADPRRIAEHLQALAMAYETSVPTDASTAEAIATIDVTPKKETS